MGHPNPAAGRAVRPVNKSYEKANCKPENICEASARAERAAPAARYFRYTTSPSCD